LIALDIPPLEPDIPFNIGQRPSFVSLDIAAMDLSSKGLTVPSFRQKDNNILIRRTRYSDIPHMATIAAAVFQDSDLNKFLCPYRHQHPNHFIRRFLHMFQARHFDPRSLGFVAVESSSPGKPVAYIQLSRLGDDEAARQLIAAQDSLWRRVCHWMIQLRNSIVNYLWHDRSSDHDAVRRFGESAKRDSEKYWESEEMRAQYGNRWHVRGLVVSLSHQRRGIGRALMGEVMSRAQREGVVVGLEASEDGEMLYRAMGFTMRGPFSMVIGSPVGGCMMWTPEQSE
jgi:GNAT superfamily N-acetyltransferase